MNFLKSVLSTIFLCWILISAVQSKTVRHKFHVSYITGSPDGVDHHFILGINGKFPGPVIEGNVGDTMEILVVNGIQDGSNVSIHWHGIHQTGTPFQDGPSYVTQCPLKFGSHQLYSFLLDEAGSFWYHSHVSVQYVAGLWGALIVHNLPEVYDYDAELILTLCDWFHFSWFENKAWMLNPNNTAGAVPYPDSLLLNGMGRYPCPNAEQVGRVCNPSNQIRPVFTLTAGKTYRIRVINTSAGSPIKFSIDNHTLEAIEVDAIDVAEPLSVDYVTIGPAQRYSFILRPNLETLDGSRFLLRVVNGLPVNNPSTNINPFADILQPNHYGMATGVIVYTTSTSTSEDDDSLVSISTESFGYTRNLTLEAPYPINAASVLLDDALLLPFDHELAVEYDSVRHFFQLNVSHLINLGDGIQRMGFNGNPLILPESGKPLLAIMKEGGGYPDRSEVFELDFMVGVQINLYNPPGAGGYPIHLHGHDFHVVYHGTGNSGFFNPTVEEMRDLPLQTVKRDTVLLAPSSTLIIRFETDNPGMWFLHCHIDWHLEAGLALSFAEATSELRNLAVPPEARRVCKEHGVHI